MTHPSSPQLTSPAHMFTTLLPSTPRGARLARHLCVTTLRSWGASSDLTERAELVVAELAANAVTHGRLPGRGFRMALMYAAVAGHLRIELTDARGDRLPHRRPTGTPLPTHGRGLLLVSALCTHWETVAHPPGGKTVVAVLPVVAPDG
ncbi:ATP-binding protein [Streptomyces sp. NPDC059897]|uniref:ATP-binding protein n=1 Tax=Streptomyces sp. NPDC059897 TaxID=3346994 RepID=UPI003650BD54